MKQANQEGLVEAVLKETIPMHGRMIRGKDKHGNLTEGAQQYDVHGRSIHAVDRSNLNKRLLNALESIPNVNLYFNHKLTGADFKTRKAWFEKRSTSETESDGSRAPEIEVAFDLLIGADGAHSAARFHLMKYTRLNYQQGYIDTLWCELQISAQNSSFALSPNHLHIWPGKYHMFIAVPSLDKSFTCTLFATHGTFDALAKDPHGLLPDFFRFNFPGVSPELIPTDELIKQFQRNPHLPLINIKCSPYHYGSSAVILGDAAHAMVPFYGQGMNAGLEDVRVLFDCLDAHGVYTKSDATTLPAPTISVEERRAEALAAYTEQRAPDADAISALALQNYREMRADVVSPVYRARKWAEEALSRALPRMGWQTQYRRVSFTNQRYSEVVRAVRWQGRALAVLAAVCGGSGVWVLWWVLKVQRVVLMRQWLVKWMNRILDL